MEEPFSDNLHRIITFTHADKSDRKYIITKNGVSLIQLVSTDSMPIKSIGSGISPPRFKSHLWKLGAL